MKKKISPVLIVLALAAVFLAGLIFILLVGPSKPNGFIEGSVVDAQTGEAVPGVDVMAVDSAGISYDKRENTDATRQDGSFRLELPPGDYTLLVPPGHASKAAGQKRTNLIYFRARGYRLKIRETEGVEPYKPEITENL